MSYPRLQSCSQVPMLWINILKHLESYQKKFFFCLNTQKDKEKQILCTYWDELCSCILNRRKYFCKGLTKEIYFQFIKTTRTKITAFSIRFAKTLSFKISWFKKKKATLTLEENLSLQPKIRIHSILYIYLFREWQMLKTWGVLFFVCLFF